MPILKNYAKKNMWSCSLCGVHNQKNAYTHDRHKYFGQDQLLCKRCYEVVEWKVKQKEAVKV